MYSTGWEAGKNTRVKIMGKTEVTFLQFFALRVPPKQACVEAIKMVTVIGSNNLLVPHLDLLLPEILTSGTCAPGMSLLSFLQLCGLSRSVLVPPGGCSWLALMPWLLCAAGWTEGPSPPSGVFHLSVIHRGSRSPSRPLCFSAWEFMSRSPVNLSVVFCKVWS